MLSISFDQLLARATLGPLDWEPFRPGVSIARLYDHGDGHSAALLRYEPGARVPRHAHPGFEHILVLQGSQQDERGAYRAGTLLVNLPGSEHAVESPEGCVVLAVWEKAVVFL
jgi:anti-sigma factor ChrR (cupin superfamily)